MWISLHLKFRYFYSCSSDQRMRYTLSSFIPKTGRDSSPKQDLSKLIWKITELFLLTNIPDTRKRWDEYLTCNTNRDKKNVNKQSIRSHATTVFYTGYVILISFVPQDSVDFVCLKIRQPAQFSVAGIITWFNSLRTVREKSRRRQRNFRPRVFWRPAE